MPKTAYFVRCPRCGENFDEKLKSCPYCHTLNRKIVCKTCGRYFWRGRRDLNSRALFRRLLP